MAGKQKTTGRPAKNSDTGERVMHYDTELHALICERLPEFVKHGRIRVQSLAAAMGYSEYRIYCILQANKLSVRAANALIAISKKVKDRPEGQGLKESELVKFLLN